MCAIRFLHCIVNLGNVYIVTSAAPHPGSGVGLLHSEETYSTHSNLYVIMQALGERRPATNC